MITLKQLTWSNAFSYGRNNTVNFVNSPLTQLVGKNGHGKSSVALILEEVLFNKNSKSIKKADILNRYIKDKTYAIELTFDKDNNSYEIRSSRGNTQTVKLLKNGVDISGHTATATYKIIEDILGFDHKTFAQIVYQSHASSLEFLTAPDTARKKFLIELLSLGKYTKAAEVFKDVSTELSKEIAAVQSQINTVNTWLNKYTNTNLELKALVQVPELDDSLISESAQINSKITDLETTNKKINQNNTYKAIQANLKIFPIPEEPQESTAEIDSEVSSLTKESIELTKSIKDSKAFVDKMAKLNSTCPTCLQSIDSTAINNILQEQKDLRAQAEITLEGINAMLAALASQKAEIQAKKTQWQTAIKAKEDWERYHALIDETLQSELLDKNELESKFELLQSKITILRKAIADAEKHNREAETHNVKVETITKQLVEMQEELEKYSGKLHELSERMAVVNILTKTFSTTGLVAYKIECLVKDLEEITNKYLIDLSDGRFQISFKINASDKLNVVITDNGKDIDIVALSGGERARVNAATLLAIRKLMQSLSSSRINLLILDETVEALDVDGKERLVEVLLREEYLNTFLVSHGFSHPLLEKLHVIKENNISRIEV